MLKFIQKIFKKDNEKEGVNTELFDTDLLELKDIMFSYPRGSNPQLLVDYFEIKEQVILYKNNPDKRKEKEICQMITEFKNKWI